MNGVVVDTDVVSYVFEKTRALRGQALKKFKATLDALAEGAGDLPALPSAAFSRESIYRDHD